MEISMEMSQYENRTTKWPIYSTSWMYIQRSQFQFNTEKKKENTWHLYFIDRPFVT